MKGKELWVNHRMYVCIYIVYWKTKHPYTDKRLNYRTIREHTVLFAFPIIYRRTVCQYCSVSLLLSTAPFVSFSFSFSVYLPQCVIVDVYQKINASVTSWELSINLLDRLLIIQFITVVYIDKGANLQIAHVAFYPLECFENT